MYWEGFEIVCSELYKVLSARDVVRIISSVSHWRAEYIIPSIRTSYMVCLDCRLIDLEKCHVSEFICKIGGRVVAAYGVPWRPKGFLLKSV